VLTLVSFLRLHFVNPEEENMRIRFRTLVFSFGLIVVLAALSSAQDNASRINTIQTKLNNAKQAYEQMSELAKKSSHSARRLAQLADTVNRIAPGLAKGPSPGWQPSAGWDEGEADENGLVQVNNPARDLRFSPFAGYTQNTSKTARCGDNVVVAFNDSGSLLETIQVNFFGAGWC
jgi:hypothetical protein